MSAFTHLMQDSILIRRLAGTDPRGGKTYTPPLGQLPIAIKGRLDWKRRKVINSKGEESVSEATLYTPERLNTGDLIAADGREWPVIAVSERKSLYGSTDHWEVMI